MIRKDGTQTACSEDCAYCALGVFLWQSWAVLSQDYNETTGKRIVGRPRLHEAFMLACYHQEVSSTLLRTQDDFICLFTSNLNNHVYDKLFFWQGILGHGAFAVENLRTCLEYSCKQASSHAPVAMLEITLFAVTQTDHYWVTKCHKHEAYGLRVWSTWISFEVYMICRRKNLACPRAWFPRYSQLCLQFMSKYEQILAFTTVIYCPKPLFFFIFLLCLFTFENIAQLRWSHGLSSS